MSRRTILVGALALVLASLACLSQPATPTATVAPIPSPTPEASPTAIALAPTSTTVADHYKAMRAGFEPDVDTFANGLHYWVTLDVHTDPVRVTGHEKLHYVNRTGQTLKDAVFRLFLNGLGDKSLQEITGVSVDGQPLKTETSVGDSVVRVTLPRDLAPEATMDFEIDFGMTMDQGLGVKYGRVLDLDGEVTLSSFLPLIAVYGRDGWSEDAPVPQGDPAYSETALFDVMLTSPSDEKVASSGVVLGQTQNSDGTTLRTIVTGPVRDFSMALSRDFSLLEEVRDGITVNVWSLPGAKTEANQEALAKAEAALTIYNRQYGPYPFSQFDVVESPITAGGIEYPGLIYIASDDWDTTKFFFEVVIAHETAHQWWYSVVGDDQIREPWMDESLANYSVEVYYAAEYGEQAGRGVRDSYQQAVNNYLSQPNHKAMPIGLPVGQYTEEQYGIFVYEDGPLLYSYFADQYGQDAVLRLLRAYYTQFRYRIAHTSDLERLVNDMLGPAAKKYFDQQVLGGL